MNCKVSSFFGKTSTVCGLQIKHLIWRAVPITDILEIHSSSRIAGTLNRASL